MSKTPLVYWDSCVFVSHIERSDPARVPMIDAVFAESDAKKIRLVTSTFAVSEVAFSKAERYAGVLDPDVEVKIEELWTPGGPVTLIDYQFAIAKIARGLMRDAIASTPQRSLKGKDAVHIASAKHVGAVEMHTYDDKLHAHSSLAGLTICAPREQEATLLSQAPPQSAPPQS